MWPKIALMMLIASIARNVSADAVSVAREHFERGTVLFDISKFHEAAAEYEEAYKAKNDPALLFNIGQAYRLAGEHEAALWSYKSYLRKKPDARNRQTVDLYIERLRQMIEQSRPALVQPAPEIWTRPAVSTVVQTTEPVPVQVVRKKPPLPRRWWLWASISGTIVASLVVGLTLGLTPNDASGPLNTVPLHLQ